MPTFMTQLQRLREQAQADNIPVISPPNAAFLTQMLTQSRPQRVLEIGSAVGISSAHIAHTIAPWGGRLVTIEISVPTQAQAAANLAALGLHNVLSLCGDARVLLAQWAHIGKPPSKPSEALTAQVFDFLAATQADGFRAAGFDCIFIDAQKNQSHVFYTLAAAVLSAQGLIMVDDAWLYRHKMQAFYSLLSEKMQAYRLHFVDGKDATMLITPSKQS